MSARIDRQRLEAWIAFLRAHSRVVGALDAELEVEAGMPLTWYEVLLFLQRDPTGRLRMNELAESLVLSRSGLTRLIDRMVGEGLVERTECPSDRRGVMAAITPKGRRAFKAATPVHMRGVKQHFTDHLSDTEASSLKRVLDRMLAAEGRAKAS